MADAATPITTLYPDPPNGTPADVGTIYCAYSTTCGAMHKLVPPQRNIMSVFAKTTPANPPYDRAHSSTNNILIIIYNHKYRLRSAWLIVLMRLAIPPACMLLKSASSRADCVTLASISREETSKELAKSYSVERQGAYWEGGVG